MDAKKKKLLYIGAGTTGTVLLAVGLTVAFMANDKESPSKTPFETRTPTAADAAKQPGDLSVQPTPVQLAAAPDGTIRGVANVAALFQNFTATSVEIAGADSRFSYETDCLANGKVIIAGATCQVSIRFNPAITPQQTTPNGAPAGLNPEFVVTGQTVTPGGAVKPIERRVAILPPNANAQGVPVGQPTNGIITSTVAPNGLDPYGPVSPQAAAAAAQASAPAPTPQGVDMGGQQVAQQQPMLSPREQFILARRQAVFASISRSAAAEQPKPTGGWDDLKIPSTTSSLPQDMSRVVTMNRIITAVLTRPYDSRSSQQVVAQVDRNVYSASGRNILIPRGSQLIGTAQGGAERVAIQWTQIIRPDGARLVIEATGGDASGKAGVPGRVNERLMKRYGSILLGTILSGGTAKLFGARETPGAVVGSVTGSNQDGSSSNPGVARNNGAIITDIVRRDIERIVQDIVQRNQNVQPIITVPAGTRMTIVPTMDLVMRQMTGPVEEAVSYPRRMNAGAAAPTFTPQMPNQSVGFDVPQARQQQAAAPVQPPLPAANVPAAGSTPPWGSN